MSREWLTTDAFPGTLEERVARVVARTYRGLHHVVYWRRRKVGDDYVMLSVPAGMSTYDFDDLTRLVVAAHDECVRVTVYPGGPRMLRLLLTPRHQRDGSSMERHPTIEEAIPRART